MCIRDRIVTVNLNLIIRMKYITLLHALSFMIMSFGAYLGFMWFTNFVEFGWTHYSIEQVHSSPLFYLTITVTVGASFMLDLFLECASVLLKTSPTSMLRSIIRSRSSIENPLNLAKFEAICAKV